MAKPPELHTRTTPRRKPCRASMSETTRSASSAPRRAWAASSSPAGLGAMPRGRRSNSGTPSISSSPATWRLTAEGETLSRVAASLTEPLRTTSRK